MWAVGLGAPLSLADSENSAPVVCRGPSLFPDTTPQRRCDPDPDPGPPEFRRRTIARIRPPAATSAPTPVASSATCAPDFPVFAAAASVGATTPSDEAFPPGAAADDPAAGDPTAEEEEALLPLGRVLVGAELEALVFDGVDVAGRVADVVPPGAPGLYE